MNIGFIGLGHMGKPIALNLVKNHKLKVFDIRREPVLELVKAGASDAGSLANVFPSSDIIMTCLAELGVLEGVVYGSKGLLEMGVKGQVLIVLDTAPPSLIRKIKKSLEPKGIDVLDAPVTGGVRGSTAGTLTVMVGGNRETFEKCEPVFNAMGKRIYYTGESGCGEVVKCVNNYLSFCNLVSTVEGIVLGVKAGVSTKTLYEVISHGSGRSHAVEWRLPNQLGKHKFDFGSFYQKTFKDFDCIADLAKENNYPLFMGSLARQIYEMGVAKGLGPLDHASVLKVFEELAGVTISFPDAYIPDANVGA